MYRYLPFLILVFPDVTLGRTCEERLNFLEGVVQNLIEKDDISHNGDTDSGNKFTLKIQSLEESRQDVKETLADLKILLAKSNRRIQDLETRVFELETSEKNRKARSPDDSIYDNKVEFESHKRKLRTNTDNLTDNLPQENTTFGILRGQVHNELHRDITHKKSIHLKEQQPSQIQKRIPADAALFTAYISVQETEISQGHTIIFDTIVTNVGNHYNRHSGVFTAPQDGVYVFSWNLYCQGGGAFISQLVVNSNVVGGMYTDASDNNYAQTTTNVVVVVINSGDVIFVRIHPTMTHLKTVKSSTDYRSSFSGWKLY